MPETFKQIQLTLDIFNFEGTEKTVRDIESSIYQGFISKSKT